MGERDGENGAPVFVIRDVASEVGVRRQQHGGGTSQPTDIVTRGLLSVKDAESLMELSVSFTNPMTCYVTKLTEAGSKNTTGAGSRSARRSPLTPSSQKSGNHRCCSVPVA